MRGEVTGLTDPATPLVAGLLFLLAVPTTWIVALLELDPVVSVTVGVITSFPLWFALGARLAVVSRSWGQWWGRYLLWAIGWAVAAMVLLAVVASLAG